MPNTVIGHQICLKPLCLAKEFVHRLAKYEEMESPKSQIHFLKEKKGVCVCLQIGCPKVWREVFTDKENEAENAAQKTAAWSGVFDPL